MKSLNKLEMILTIVCLLLIVYVPQWGLIISFFSVLIYLLIGKDRKIKFNSIGFKRTQSWLKTVLISLGLGIVIELSFQILINPLFDKLTGSMIDLSNFDSVQGNLSVYLAMLAIGFIIGGLFEEILFRGFLMTRIAQFFNSEAAGFTVAIISTSAIFGFSHMYQGWSGVLNTGFTAVIFGIIFLKFNKNLWYAIFTHGFVNLVGFTVLYLGIGEDLRTLIF